VGPNGVSEYYCAFCGVWVQIVVKGNRPKNHLECLLLPWPDLPGNLIWPAAELPVAAEPANSSLVDSSSVIALAR
jgi:hypothetical protein